MTDFDLVIRNGRIATAADIFESDIGVKDGAIAALARSLPKAKQEIDAAGRWVLPGGIDGHCHFDQPMTDGSKMADDFHTGTLSAACGGTTTVIPFACQLKGQSLQAAVDDYHRRAEGKSVIDYAFHMIVSDPTERVLKEELPRLVANGYTSFKIYMTYDDLKLNDRQILETLAVARREGAMGDDPRREHRLHRLAHRAAPRRGTHGTEIPRRVAPDAGRARGHAPGDRALGARRHPDPDRARFRSRGGRADPLGAGQEACGSTAKPARSTFS